jgi:hypothetical protein
MKMPSVYTDIRFKQVFENTTDGRNSRCRSVVHSACWELQLSLIVRVPAGSRSTNAPGHARFTGGPLWQKNTHNSATIRNRTHIVINIFDHKGLGNLLLRHVHKSCDTQYVFCLKVFQYNIKCVIFVCFSMVSIWIRRYQVCLQTLNK